MIKRCQEGIVIPTLEAHPDLSIGYGIYQVVHMNTIRYGILLDDFSTKLFYGLYLYIVINKEICVIIVIEFPILGGIVDPH